MIRIIFACRFFNTIFFCPYDQKKVDVSLLFAMGRCSSQAGLLLTLWVAVVYKIALAYEG